MSTAEDDEHVLAVANNIQVREVNQKSVEDADNVLGKDIQMCLARLKKRLDDLQRAVNVPEKIKESRREGYTLSMHRPCCLLLLPNMLREKEKNGLTRDASCGGHGRLFAQ